MTIVSPAPRRLHRPWRLTVDRFLRMAKAGILTKKDRVLLWKGQLVEKMTKGRPHVVTESYLDQALTADRPRRLVCRAGSPDGADSAG